MCEACDRAMLNAEAGLTQASCVECQAREIARVHKDSDPQATTMRIRKLYPIDRWNEMRSRVWQWIKRREAQADHEGAID